MANHILTFFILLTSFTTFGQEAKVNKFITWDEFVDGFGREMVFAEDVFKGMAKDGLKDNTR